MNSKLTFKDIHTIRRENTIRLFSEKGLSREDFAAKIKIAYSQLGHYIGKNPTKNIGDAIAKRIEDAFGLPSHYLDQDFDLLITTFDGNVNFNEKIEIIKEVPVISWVQAGNWTQVMSTNLAETIDSIPYIPDVGPNGYGLIVEGESMSPWFLPGDRIYVNPDLAEAASNDDLVIAMCNYATEATFKKLVIEMGQKYLIPLNKEWPGPKSITLDSSCEIKGMVVGLYRPVNKRMIRTIH